MIKGFKLFLLIFVVSMLLPACTQINSGTSTAKDREQLFDYIIEKTQERTAFSPVKQQMLGFDPIAEMEKFRVEMIDANTDEALFEALLKISNARKDRHLKVRPIIGGLKVDQSIDARAPVIFRTDFSDFPDCSFFLADYSKSIADYTELDIKIGDKLITVNKIPIKDYFTEMKAYFRYSTNENLYYNFASSLNHKSYSIAPTMDQEFVEYELEQVNGNTYKIKLPYLNPEKIKWFGYYKPHGINRYLDFNLVLSKQTYDLYISKAHKHVILLDWYGFHGDLVTDMDYLIDYATEHKMLNWDIIIDATRSRGGSKGAYAVQRLFKKPFKTTFGNLKISDITPLFIAQKEEDFKKGAILDGEVTETMDDGSWLMDWLRTDVKRAIQNKDEYSTNVPFKSAHAAKDSDGILYPTKIHFTGNVVCLFGPHGGSHLDQFSSIVIDNNLAYTVGMPTGGYSNTWEWTENLQFPVSGKPVVSFMWDIGHTIRPNGEILEGNAAKVDGFIPETSENYLNYYDLLLEEAFNHLKN